MSGEETYESLLVSQHRRLEAMFAEVAGALRDGEPIAAVRATFATVRESLEAHVDQEDRLYYPALRALRPEHRVAIARLVEDHVEFRGQLAAIAQILGAERRDQTIEAVAAFVRSFAAHEAAEEKLLQAVDAELAAGA